MERKMRRFRQELSPEASLRILTEGRFAVMALAGDDDYPYAIPINYVLSGNVVYIHCARSGHKIDSIRRNPKCSLCVVDKDDVVPEEFTSYFRSVIAFGKAYIVDDTEETVRALRLLCDKYSPGIGADDEIGRCLQSVCVIRIEIEKITGKEAIELTIRAKHGES